MTILGARQVATLGRIIDAFAWPSMEPPCVALIDTTLDLQVVHLLDADKDGEEDTVLEFGIDEDGGLWLFEWTQEMVAQGEYAEFWPAVLREEETRIDGATFRASFEEAPEELVRGECAARPGNERPEGPDVAL